MIRKLLIRRRTVKNKIFNKIFMPKYDVIKCYFVDTYEFKYINSNSSLIVPKCYNGIKIISINVNKIVIQLPLLSYNSYYVVENEKFDFISPDFDPSLSY